MVRISSVLLEAQLLAMLLRLFGLLAVGEALQLRGLPLSRAGGRAGRIRCGWGPEPVWTANTIASIEEAAGGLVSITVTPEDEVSKGFTTPGQYVQ